MVCGWSRRSAAQLYQWSIILMGSAALALGRPDWSREPEVLVCLAILFALAEYLPTRVRVGAISFSFPMAYTAFLLYGPTGAALVAAAGTAAANAARRRAWGVTWFNATQFSLSALAAGELSLIWPGRPTLEHYILPLLAYTVYYYFVNNLIVDGILLIRLKRYRLADWMAKNRFEMLSAAVSLVYCIMMMLLAPQRRGHDPLALTFFYLPLLTVGGFVRLLTHLSRFANQMATLVQVSSLVTFAPDGAGALDRALAHLDAFDEFRYAAVYAVEGDELAAVAVHGIPREALTHPRIPVGEGLSGWAARHGETVIAPEARQEARNTLGEGIREGAAMLAAFPLVSGGTVIGVLTLGKERSRSFQPEDLRPLTIFANLAAALLRHLHLVEERERLLLEQERNRLAREIHDGLAQSLAGSLLQMDRLDRTIETDPRAARRLLQSLREHLREVLLEVRRSIFNLRPSPLEERCLVAVLRQEVQRVREKGLMGEGAEVRVEVRGEQRRLSGLVEDEVYRIAQECLANAVKHAGATEIAVQLGFTEARLRLSVRDNGCGFRLADAVRTARERSRFGLAGISERADRLGAAFEIDSRPGGGTRVTVDVPLMGE